MTKRILRMKELAEYLGLAESTLWERIKEDSKYYDPDFPKKIRLGSGSVGWDSEAVDQWLKISSAQPRDGAATPKKVRVTDRPRTPAAVKSTLPAPPVRAKAPRPTGSRSMGETLIAGERINARIQSYLQLPTWTPVMGALLVSGIAAPVDCDEIPDGGMGLDQLPVHASNARFHEARRILLEWREWEEDNEAQASAMAPADFLTWCQDQEIKTGWLTLILEVAGCGDEKTAELNAARLAMLTNK